MFLSQSLSILSELWLSSIAVIRGNSTSESDFTSEYQQVDALPNYRVYRIYFSNKTIKGYRGEISSNLPLETLIYALVGAQMLLTTQVKIEKAVNHCLNGRLFSWILGALLEGFKKVSW